MKQTEPKVVKIVWLNKLNMFSFSNPFIAPFASELPSVGQESAVRGQLEETTVLRQGTLENDPSKLVKIWNQQKLEHFATVWNQQVFPSFRSRACSGSRAKPAFLAESRRVLPQTVPLWGWQLATWSQRLGHPDVELHQRF